jgi:beta-xylosidase
LGWYSVRTPVRQEYSLAHRPNTLTIFGNPFRIDQLESPALLCRKQQYHAGTWLTSLDFDPDTEYDEAGTAVFWSNFSFISLVVRKKGQGRELVLRWNAYEDDKRQVSLSRPDGHGRS